MKMTADWRRLAPVGFAIVLMGAGGDRPALLDAVKNGDQSTVKALLQKKVNVNETDGDGSTALIWASYRDDKDSADLLLRAGADVNARTDLGVTPLWAACQNGSVAMVRRLLEAGANPNTPLLPGETPLMTASRSGKAEIAELLLAKGANVNAKATRGQTALMWAVAEKHPEVVKVLLAHGADVQARSDSWSKMMAVPPHGYLPYNRQIPHGSDTALLFAARVGDLASAKLLLAAGAKVNDADAWGVTPVVLAAHSGFNQIVDLLLEKGADPNLAEAGFTALHIAIMRNDEAMASALLSHGANPNTPLKVWTPTRRSSKDYNFNPALVGATPFWLAARFGQPGVMRLLASRGADPKFVHSSNSVTGLGYQPRKEMSTALMAALGIGGAGNLWVQPAAVNREAIALESAKLAVELGVDINATTADGRTALDAAKALRYQSVVDFLAQKGAKAGAPTRPATPRTDSDSKN